MTSIGKKIRDARKNAGMTQVELAKATNLSRSYIGDIEKDRYNPSVSTLQAIAKATNVPVETLLGGASPAPPAPQKSDGLPELNARDERDRTANGGPAHASAREMHQLEKILAEPNLTYNGVALGAEDIEKINRALELAFWDAKEKNKRKK